VLDIEGKGKKPRTVACPDALAHRLKSDAFDRIWAWTRKSLASTAKSLFLFFPLAMMPWTIFKTRTKTRSKILFGKKPASDFQT